ncbi:hypothetical protein D3C79_855750 [compost metagenome]
MQGHAVDVDMFAQDVPGSTGNVGDNGRLTSGQNVEQARLAGIRPTGDHYGHAITQQGPLPGLTLHCG